ncbi:hypothetical protein K438DRAFT_612389 [Mycena galopus ATCC 62051]|nr:hypothetical protein K438DRAFT_612389 [Mycena galopus ATCC 62051]
MAGIGQITICESEGATVSTLWQYGHVNWELLYSCIRTVIVAAHDWAIFPFDAHAPGQHKDVIPPSDLIAQPGKYVLLCSDGRPISVQLTTLAARTRHPVVSNTRAGGDHYHKRVQARDPCCLITGRAVVGHDFSRFTATHIYPRSHDTEVGVLGLDWLTVDTDCSVDGSRIPQYDN